MKGAVLDSNGLTQGGIIAFVYGVPAIHI